MARGVWTCRLLGAVAALFVLAAAPAGAQTVGQPRAVPPETGPVVTPGPLTLPAPPTLGPGLLPPPPLATVITGPEIALPPPIVSPFTASEGGGGSPGGAKPSGVGVKIVEAAKAALKPAAAAEEATPPATATPGAPAPVAAPFTSKAMQDAYEAAMISYYKRNQALNEIAPRAFRMQETYGNLIIALVFVLVAAGLIFSAIQFWIALRTGRQVQTGALDMKLGGSLVVQTSALGISILAISIVFFYLMIEKVYMIQVIK